MTTEHPSGGPELRSLILGGRWPLIKQRDLEIDRAPIGYLRFDAQCQVVDWNTGAQRMFGFRKSEMIGIGPPFEKFVPRDFWPEAEKLIDRLQRGDMAANSVNDNL